MIIDLRTPCVVYNVDQYFLLPIEIMQTQNGKTSLIPSAPKQPQVAL